MTTAQGQRLLDALLDSWDRNNTILLNLLRAIPAGGLDARAMVGSPTVSEMFTHMHDERMVSVLENCPETRAALDLPRSLPSRSDQAGSQGRRLSDCS
jgi:hypothetical protein